MNEVRGGTKGTFGIVSGMQISWNPLLLMEESPEQINILHIDTSSSLIGNKPGSKQQLIRLFSAFISSTLESPFASVVY